MSQLIKAFAKLTAAALITAVAVVALSACSAPPDHGVIHAKQFNLAYTYLLPVSTGKTTILVPEYEPASWEMDVYASKDDHGWVYVDQATYDRFHVGDFYRQ